MFGFLYNLPAAQIITCAYYVIRLLTHRNVLSDPKKGFRVDGLVTEPSTEDESLALKVIEEIESIEELPIRQVSDEKVKNYITTLNNIVATVSKKEYSYFPEEGSKLLEEFQRPNSNPKNSLPVEPVLDSSMEPLSKKLYRTQSEEEGSSMGLNVLRRFNLLLSTSLVILMDYILLCLWILLHVGLDKLVITLKGSEVFGYTATTIFRGIIEGSVLLIVLIFILFDLFRLAKNIVSSYEKQRAMTAYSPYDVKAKTPSEIAIKTVGHSA